MSELTLGRKLYAFREDRKLSQSRLEVEAGLSFGTISRIENGLVNPTKETLVKIGEILNLDDNEFNYLIKSKSTFPTLSEVEIVRTEFKAALIESEFPSYIMDCGFRIWQWNDMVLELFDIDENTAEQHVGKTCMQILFSRNFNIINNIPKDKLLGVIRDQVWSYRRIIYKHRYESMTIEKVRELKRDGLFRRVWDEFDVFKREEAFGDNFYYNYRGNKLAILITIGELGFDNRFLLVRYYPKDLQTAEVFEKLRREVGDN